MILSSEKDDLVHQKPIVFLAEEFCMFHSRQIYLPKELASRRCRTWCNELPYNDMLPLAFLPILGQKLLAKNRNTCKLYTCVLFLQDHQL